MKTTFRYRVFYFRGRTVVFGVEEQILAANLRNAERIALRRARKHAANERVSWFLIDEVAQV